MLCLMKIKWGTHWTSQGFGLDPEYPQFPNALPRVLTWLKHLSSALVASEKPEKKIFPLQNKLCIKFETTLCHLKVDRFLTDRKWHMITQYKEIKMRTMRSTWAKKLFALVVKCLATALKAECCIILRTEAVHHVEICRTEWRCSTAVLWQITWVDGRSAGCAGHIDLLTINQFYTVISLFYFKNKPY